MYRILIVIPLSIEPLERGERFDLPLCDLFDETEGGDVIGGGTSIKEGEIESVEVEIELKDIDLLPEVARVLIRGAAPPETLIQIKSPNEKSIFLSEFLENLAADNAD